MKSVIKQRERRRHLDLHAEQLQGQRRAQLVSPHVARRNGYGDRKVGDEQDEQARGKRGLRPDSVEHELDASQIAEPRSEHAGERNSHAPPAIEDLEASEERQLTPPRVPTNEGDHEDREDGYPGEQQQPRTNGRRQLRHEPRQRCCEHYQCPHVAELLQAHHGQSERERNRVATPQDPDAEGLACPRWRQDRAHRCGNRIAQQRPKRHWARCGQSEAPEGRFPGETGKGDQRSRCENERFCLHEGATQAGEVELVGPNDDCDNETDRAKDMQREAPLRRRYSSGGVCDWGGNELSHGCTQPYRQWPRHRLEGSFVSHV